MGGQVSKEANDRWLADITPIKVTNSSKAVITSSKDINSCELIVDNG
jgi:hypothetical protein